MSWSDLRPCCRLIILDTSSTASSLSTSFGLHARAYRANSFKLDRFRTLTRRSGLAHLESGEAPPTPRKRSPGWFSRMHRGVDGARSRSPSMQPDGSPDRRQREPLAQHSSDRVQSEMPRMPAFLELDQEAIKAKFDDITFQERVRTVEAQRTPDSAFARPDIVGSKILDRYANIHPYTSNRIRLKVSGNKSDYINASPIALKSEVGSDESRYIAMQGPKSNSINHVWRMIFHELESPAVMVMLTETHENGLEKCHQYYPGMPDDEPLVINEDEGTDNEFKANVKCIEHSFTGLNDSIEVRKLVMAVEGEQTEKTIWHLLYRKWPDFGVPSGEDVDAFFEVMNLSQAKNVNPQNPRVIHCSAGVGRSGTFITLDHLMREVRAGALEVASLLADDEKDLIYNTVCDLRTQRTLMVQAEVQYAFVYAQVRRLWEEKYCPGRAIPRITVDSASNGNDVFT